MTKSGRPVSAGILAGVLAVVATPLRGTEPEHPDIVLFFQAASLEDEPAEAALAAIAEVWRDEYTALLIDLARFMRPRRRSPSPTTLGARGAGSGPDDPRGGAVGSSAGATGAAGGGSFPSPVGAPEHPTTRVRERLIRFMVKQTGQDLGDDLRKWRRWYWNRPYEPHPGYRMFKAALYRQVDEKMVGFFTGGGKERIRLDEIDWGGVGVNGIPPLDHPAHLPASEADYLGDKDVVFGIVMNGEARAYPKRILAWHEMALDGVGGVELAIVYCTLCGTVIPYGAELAERRFTFGTSGLLYRSNKLMFDAETLSLWSTVEGRPVLGPLSDSEPALELTAYPVVTTRWREWRTLHPETTVLSLDTGHDRDYSEGAAYRDYFRSDRLMFAVPALDDRLKNKDEVLALALRPAGSAPEAPRRALAIAAKFLRKKEQRLFHKRFAGHELVVVTSRDGANRVYDAGKTRFVAQLEDGRLRDGDGGVWRLTEEALVPETSPAVEPRLRVAARRAFWFGWYAQYPATELVE